MGAALVLAAQPQRAPNIQRVCAISFENEEKRIRLSTEQFNIISLDYHNYRLRTKPRAQYSISRRNMELFLYYIAGGGYYRQVSFPFGIAISTAWLAIHEVADHFHRISENFISLPLHQELHDLVFTELEGQRVVLLLDGFIVPISKPYNSGDAYYCARPGKHYDSICVQYFVDKYGKIRHIITGLPGSTHDKTAVEFSVTIMNYLNELPPYYIVLADSAYQGLHPRVKTLRRGILNEIDRAFNTLAAGVRQLVERAIGASELYWRIQQSKENRIAASSGPLFPAKCTIAAAVLHNSFTNYVNA